jgi:hypothetical protein
VSVENPLFAHLKNWGGSWLIPPRVFRPPSQETPTANCPSLRQDSDVSVGKVTTRSKHRSNYRFLRRVTPLCLGYLTQLKMNGTPPNPQWRVSCRSCLASFAHSYVGRSRRIEDYLHPTEPDFPTEGLELKCPHCEGKAVYRASDVRFYLK